MNSIEHIVVHFGLLVFSSVGAVLCLLVLRTALADLQALNAEKVNGQKRLGVIGRIIQSAFIFSVFMVLVGAGARIALADEYELLPPLVLTLIVLFDVVAGVLMANEFMTRLTRGRLDRYYDASVDALGSTPYIHSRSTDR